MKTASRLAMVAAAGIMMGGFSLSAKAADLGGDCCADLETRVAELEATTARKGNRKVSLEISGQVNRALMVWDDGIDSDAYVVDNDTSSTRFRFKGSGTMKPGWKAGFLIEIEVQDAASNNVDQFNDEGVSEFDALFIRHANWYIESERLGRITLGQGSPATDDLTLINLGGSISDAELYFNNSFFLRTRDKDFDSKLFGKKGFFDAVVWGDIASGLDTPRGDFIRYDTPSIYGFILSAAWGEDDFADVALRYQQEWNSIRVAAGIGYAWDGDDNAGIFGFSDFFGAIDDNDDDDFFDSQKIVGSASIMHIPSGLYASFAAGQIEWNDGRVATILGEVNAPGNFNVRDEEREASFYYIQLGITKRFLPYGATTFYGEYGNYDDFGENLFVGSFAVNADGDITLQDDTRIKSSDVDRWGFGVVQNFDNAALELYTQFHFYSADVEVTSSVWDTNKFKSKTDDVDIEDWHAAVVGARIKF